MYTVKKLAKISGVTIRTLHYYDEIGLLRPAYIGESGYRYYRNEQLLLLQQILFFKELGFELKQIQLILSKDNFDQCMALISHKQVLEKKIKRMHELIQTIDKTVNYIEAKGMISEKEFFNGLYHEKQTEYEQYLADVYDESEKMNKLIAKSHKNTKRWSKLDWDKVKFSMDLIYKDLAVAIELKEKIDSPKVQTLIADYFTILKKFYNPTKAIFIGLGQLYMTHPDFKKLYDNYHPLLAEYLSKAMALFAHNEL